MPNILEEYQKRKSVSEDSPESEEAWWQRKYGQFERPEDHKMNTPTQQDASPTGLPTPSPHPIPSNPPPSSNPSATKPVQIQESYDLGPAATLHIGEESAFQSPQLEDFYRRTGKKNVGR